jgi:hypothetical protein
VASGPTTSPPPAPSGWHPAAVFAVLVVALSAVVGGEYFGLRARLWGSATPEARPVASGRDLLDPATAAPGVPLPARAAATVLRSQPWWQGVRALEGTGPATPATVAIDSGAIQWRVNWSCERGRLRVTAPNQPRALVPHSALPGGQTSPFDGRIEVIPSASRTARWAPVRGSGMSSSPLVVRARW